jgi:hypothetical protein
MNEDGTVDPWHALAILPTGGQPGVQSLGTGSVTVLIEGGFLLSSSARGLAACLSYLLTCLPAMRSFNVWRVSFRFVHFIALSIGEVVADPCCCCLLCGAGTAHCADLYAPSANDLPQLTLVRIASIPCCRFGWSCARSSPSVDSPWLSLRTDICV